MSFNAAHEWGSSDASEAGPHNQFDFDFNDKKSRAEGIIGYKFDDIELLKAALRPGNVFFHGTNIDRCQNQLAIVGDSLLKLIYFTHNFPIASPGSLNGPFDLISTNSALAFAAWNNGLAKALDGSVAPHPDDRRSAIKQAAVVVATMVEALFGAVFLDSGKDLAVTQRVIERVLARSEDELRSGDVLDRSEVAKRSSQGKAAY